MSEEHPIEVRDMALVHRMFRQAHDEAARLVRAAQAPPPVRLLSPLLTDRPYKRYAATLRTGT